MKFLRQLLIFFFSFIDQFFHQKRIQKFLEKKNIKLKTFIDVGAFEGKYTDLILKIEKNCNIIMVEPQKKYYNFLKNKYIDNPKVKIFRVGLSDQKNIKTLKINKHEITSGFSEFNKTNKYLNLKAILFESKLENMIKTEEKVEVFPLEEILRGENLNYIDLVKIDTEGHEYEVLQGSKNHLKQINYILIEYHTDKIYENYDPEKIHEFLVKNNFLLLKRFKFPFTTWQDCLYHNSKFENQV